MREREREGRREGRRKEGREEGERRGEERRGKGGVNRRGRAEEKVITCNMYIFPQRGLAQVPY